MPFRRATDGRTDDELKGSELSGRLFSGGQIPESSQKFVELLGVRGLVRGLVRVCDLSEIVAGPFDLVALLMPPTPCKKNLVRVSLWHL